MDPLGNFVILCFIKGCALVCADMHSDYLSHVGTDRLSRTCDERNRLQVKKVKSYNVKTEMVCTIENWYNGRKGDRTRGGGVESNERPKLV